MRSLMLRSPYSNSRRDCDELCELLEYAHGEDRMKRICLLFPFALALVFMPGCGGSNAKKKEPARIFAKSDWKIVATGKWSQRRLGPYYYQQDISSGKSYLAAVQTFGPPSSRGHENTSNVCIVRWRKLGLEISFSGWPTNPCSRKSLGTSGWWGTSVYSRRWHTDRGLRVGDSEKRLRSLYPKARFSDKPPSRPSWVLVRQREDEFVWDLLVAEVGEGRVTAIVTPADYIY
ncbi:MAG: hypothetical protein ACYDHO_06290 [Gaiellaceae bacterium]